MRKPLREKRLARIESLEPRTLMSAQPVAEMHGWPDLGQDELPEVFPTLTEAHAVTGWNTARADYGFDGRGQTVAVIDSGIGYDHTALGGGFGAGRRVVGGWDFTENDANPYDDGPSGGHGTHVAGIIGSTHSVHTGVAPGVDLVALRVFSDTGAGHFGWVEQALDWVYANRNSFANPITVVNLSLGSTWNSETVPNWANLEDEFQQLKEAGIFISVSAGNSFTQYNTTGLSYPAASSYVVPVASVGDNGQLSSFSQRSQRVIAAPGAGITSTVPDYRGNRNGQADEDFLRLSGTSMAAPYVAGASAVIRQALEFLGHTGVNQDTIYQWMRNTADVIHDSVTNLDYTRLNLRSALDAIMPADDFGSSADAAQSLGSLTNSTTVSGLIGKLNDRDFFRFTASVSGTVTVSANLTHGANAVWEIAGAGIAAGGNGTTFTFDVIAGETYTLGLGASGLGFYNLSFSTSAANTLATVFEESFYLDCNPDVKAAVQAGHFSSGMQHFVTYGAVEGRSPCVVFSEHGYLNQNPDVKSAVQQGWFVSGAAHFVMYGRFEGRAPSDLFSESYYLDRYADVRLAVQQGVIASGLTHFVQFGQYEGRASSAKFDGQYYLSQNPDVQNAIQQGWFQSGIEHFIMHGRTEGRLGVAPGSQHAMGPAAGFSTMGPSATFSLAAPSVNVASQGALSLAGNIASFSVDVPAEPMLNNALPEGGESLNIDSELAGELASAVASEQNDPWRLAVDLETAKPFSDETMLDEWLAFKQNELIERVDELFANLQGD